MRIKIIQKIIDKIRSKPVEDFGSQWRKLNPHNSTEAKNGFNIENVKVGKDTYGYLNIISYGSKNEKLTIGNFVSIATTATFLLSAGHSYNTISTYPFNVFFYGLPYETSGKGEIIVDDDVWIGHNATIMPGVHIGQGSVIALGSVVTKDVAPYSIVGGVPAEFIKYRFEESVCEKCLKIDYSRINKDFIMENRDILSKEIDERNIDELLKIMPIKEE